MVSVIKQGMCKYWITSIKPECMSNEDFQDLLLYIIFA